MLKKSFLIAAGLLILALDWAALDDITTAQVETDFTAEYAALTMSVPVLGLIGWFAARKP